jgi:hypothetical protein
MSEVEKHKTKCCDKEFEPSKWPVMYNPFNLIVQCHACGQIYDVATAVCSNSVRTEKIGPFEVVLDPQMPENQVMFVAARREIC